jgi:choline dehydrogenase-like flavoprotein
VTGGAVVLGASALESTRLLLNSKSTRYPAGLGNSSGQLGRNFSEHIMAAQITGFAPQLKGRMPGYPEDGHPGFSYIPQFQNVGAREKNFIRGYSFECSSGTGDYPGFAHRIGGFGASFKKKVKELYPAMVTMETNGEVLPRRENFVEIDPGGRKDPYGIPILKIHLSYGPNEEAMVRHMNDKAEEIFRAAGIEILSRHKEPKPPGWSIHEVGTARMGNDPKTSVLDRFNRSHDVPNLFVVDGASFCSATALEPTLTIMALAARASDHLADLIRGGELRRHKKT